MDFEIIYPKPARRSVFMHHLRYICGWIFLAAVFACPVINYIIGGKRWSIIVLWGIYMVWTLVLKQPLVERNLISQGVKLLLTADIMLILIDVFLYPGWAHFVVPISCFGSLIVLGVLFFINITKQRHNIMPLILVTVLAIAGSAVALLVFSDYSWPIIVLGSVSAALFVAIIVTLRMQFLVELKKRFHM
ncbi:MAG: DUF6320 domain-containing protein [Oscillospiraceae bacterium]